MPYPHMGLDVDPTVNILFIRGLHEFKVLTSTDS